MILLLRVKNRIETILGEKIVSGVNVSGGCINETLIVITESQKKYFIKTNENHPDDMFLKEAHGLSEISTSKTIRVPKVISVEKDFIIIEAIPSAKQNTTFWKDFGRAFAQMHKFSGISFGFYENNYIGSNPQINIPDLNEKNNWINFYFNKRLLFQFKLVEKNGYSDDNFRKLFSLLENKIEQILNSKNNPPSLLHGDLWNGNFIVDENGSACLIDPAVYYGHREADLAMTKFFGGFSKEFYDSYNEIFPLEDGYEYRENVYKLYHVLNHINLFGISYFSQAISILKYYV